MSRNDHKPTESAIEEPATGKPATGNSAAGAPEAERPERKPKQPINWLGVFFAFAATMLVVTIAGYIVNGLLPANRFSQPLIMLSALLAGIGTAYYAKTRGAMHAFIGGLISIPFLALITFDGAWQPAVVAGALCGMGGALGELIRGRA